MASVPLRGCPLLCHAQEVLSVRGGTVVTVTASGICKKATQKKDAQGWIKVTPPIECMLMASGIEPAPEHGSSPANPAAAQGFRGVLSALGATGGSR